MLARFICFSHLVRLSFICFLITEKLGARFPRYGLPLKAYTFPRLRTGLLQIHFVACVKQSPFPLKPATPSWS